MKIEVNGKKILELTPIQEKVIKNDIPEEIFIEDMERRIKGIISHKYEKCFERMKKEWEEKLKKREEFIPTDSTALAELIFSQFDYKSRSQRDKESKVFSGGE